MHRYANSLGRAPVAYNARQSAVHPAGPSLDCFSAVFVLRIAEGLDTAETAKCFDLSPANGKVYLHRARSLLRAKNDKQIGKDARLHYQFDGPRCDRIVESTFARIRPNLKC